MAGAGRIRSPVHGVPSVMAPLTEGAASLGVGVALVMIHVGDRQDDFAARLRVSLAVLGAALGELRRPFATVLRSLQDRRPELFPFLRTDRASGISLHLLG